MLVKKNRTKPPVLVALTGAHGTGKTTLIQALQMRLQSEGYISTITKEAPRLLCELAETPDFFRRTNNTPLRQMLIMVKHLNGEQEQCFSEAEVVLLDRGLMDHLAYTSYLHKEQLANEGVNSLLEQVVAEHASLYDLIIYIPIEFLPKDDGIREGDNGFQADIDKLILSFLQKNELNFLKVEGTVEERLNVIYPTIVKSILSRAPESDAISK